MSSSATSGMSRPIKTLPMPSTRRSRPATRCSSTPPCSWARSGWSASTRRSARRTSSSRCCPRSPSTARWPARRFELAHQLQVERGRPVLLPIRVSYHERLPPPLGGYLSPINWALWEGPEDTPRLLEQLSKAMSGEALPGSAAAPASPPRASAAPEPAPASAAASAVPAPLPSAALELDEPLEGAMDTQSAFYVVRDADSTVMKAVSQKQGTTVTIKGARQMGKSSLLMRGLAGAHHRGQAAWPTCRSRSSTPRRSPTRIPSSSSASAPPWEISSDWPTRWTRTGRSPWGRASVAGLYMSGHILQGAGGPPGPGPGRGRDALRDSLRHGLLRHAAQLAQQPRAAHHARVEEAQTSSSSPRPSPSSSSRT